MTRKWEIVRPESGEESGIGANSILRPETSQRSAGSCRLEMGWPAPSSVDGLHDTLWRDNRDIGGQRKDVAVLDRNPQQGSEPWILHI
jgi:hypothetical protein